MTDQTTQGYEADPDEVQALLDQALGDITEEADPTIRYVLLSKLTVLYDAVVSAIADERARTVASMSSPGGMSYTQIADTLQMSRPRAQQLVQRGKALGSTFAAPATASEWADALDAEMKRTGQTASDLISFGYANGQILDVILAPDAAEADDERGVIVSEQGWVVGYDAQSGYWTAR